MIKISPMILYTKMKNSVRRMKPVFHTQIDESMAEMPRNTNTMVSDPLAKTFMTYLTVVTDFSSMLELMYFWQHIPQKTILRRRTKKKIHQVFFALIFPYFKGINPCLVCHRWGAYERMADRESISAVR